MGRRLEKRMQQVMDTYETLQQHKVINRLAMLSNVTIIFMPMTFMAAISGMNFVNMPGLDRDIGYRMMIGSMLTIACLMTAFFCRIGWCSF